MRPRKAGSWSKVKAGLAGVDRPGLIGIIQNLYEANSANRRFLHARFVPEAAAIETYRTLVEDAVAPDPLSQRPIRLRDATAAITEYKRSTADISGVVDLLLTFVEAGTQQAADLGCGDDPYFAALERKAREAVAALDGLPAAARAAAEERLIRLGEYQDRIGWGYGDFLGDVAASVKNRVAERAKG
ncbi:MAG: hypothetical protein ABI051_04365 [Vicinamibacterales bacterium]